jgi:hypothetical protein
VQHFGLGDARQANEVQITWPSGARSMLGPLDGNRRWRVVEDSRVEPVGH